MVFNIVRYEAGYHSCQRAAERLNISETEAKEVIEQLVSTGKVLLDTRYHRYIKNGEMFFPCIKRRDNSFIVKSVLLWDMVKDRVQRIVDKYNID